MLPATPPRLSVCQPRQPSNCLASAVISTNKHRQVRVNEGSRHLQLLPAARYRRRRNHRSPSGPRPCGAWARSAGAGRGQQPRPPGYPIQNEVFDGLPITRVALTQRDFAPTGNNVSHPAVERIFLNLIADWHPDVIHAHHMAGLSLGILQLARTHGIRIALTLPDHWGFCMNSTRITTQNTLCHDSTQCNNCHAHIHDDDVKLPQRMRQDYLRWQLDAVDHFISPSHYLADAYIANGIPAERMHVIANGIELERFINTAPPAPGPRLNVLFIGYMGGHKGVGQ